jgi:hypothetical protein
MSSTVGKMSTCFETLYPLATLEPPRSMDEERDMEALLVDGVAVQEAAVLAEAFAMVAVDDEDRLLVDPELLILV